MPRPLYAIHTNRGQAMLLAALLFLTAAIALSAAAVGPVLRRAALSRAFADARQGLSAVNAVAEDSAYSKVKGLTVGGTETFAVGGVSATAEVVSVSDGVEIIAEGEGSNFSRAVKMVLNEGTGAAFHYCVHVGEGGLVLENSSSVSGNVFSNGPVVGMGSNIIGGEVISAGSVGLVENIHATSTVYAHTIRDADIDGDAHYTLLTGSTVDGTLFPGSPDQATSTFPISDAQIAVWKTEAAAGGTHTSPCPYTISSSVTIGPKKINCGLKISGSSTVTLAGPLWIAGTLEIENSAIVRVSPSLSGKSIAIIADDKITLQNSGSFEGAGARSYILLVSTRTSEEGILVKNSVQGDVLLFAPTSEISLENSIEMKEASAYKLTLKNNAEVIYETGLANLLFTAGPSGGYTLGSWKEIAPF